MGMMKELIAVYKVRTLIYLSLLVTLSLMLELSMISNKNSNGERSFAISNSVVLHHDELTLKHKEFIKLSTKQREPASSDSTPNDTIESFIHAKVEQLLPKQFKSEASKAANAILDQSAKYHMSPIFFLAVIQNESTFRPDIKGGHGEIGLMQIRPQTAKWICEKMKIEWKGSKALYDVAYNIKLGAGYMNLLRKKYQQDKSLYLTAYNMGVSKLNQRLAHGKSSPKQYTSRVMNLYFKFYFSYTLVSGHSVAMN